MINVDKTIEFEWNMEDSGDKNSSKEGEKNDSVGAMSKVHSHTSLDMFLSKC